MLQYQVWAPLVQYEDLGGASPANSQPTISPNTVSHQLCYSPLAVQDFRKVLVISRTSTDSCSRHCCDQLAGVQTGRRSILSGPASSRDIADSRDVAMIMLEDIGVQVLGVNLLPTKNWRPGVVQVIAANCSRKSYV